MGWTLNTTAGVFYRRDTQGRRERQRLELSGLKPRNAKDSWQSPKARRDSNLEPLKGAWPY